MTPDPIVEEVRKVRQAHAAQHGYDLEAILADMRRAEVEDPRPRASFPPKPIARPRKVATKR